MYENVANGMLATWDEAKLQTALSSKFEMPDFVDDVAYKLKGWVNPIDRFMNQFDRAYGHMLVRAARLSDVIMPTAQAITGNAAQAFEANTRSICKACDVVKKFAGPKIRTALRVTSLRVSDLSPDKIWAEMEKVEERIARRRHRNNLKPKFPVSPRQASILPTFA